MAQDGPEFGDDLRKADEKYRDFFEHAIEGIFQSTPSGRFITANPSLARLHRFTSPEELIANFSDIGQGLYVDPQRRQTFVEQLEAEGVVRNFESQIRRSDGDLRWVSENARVVTDADGKTLYYEGTVEDITEVKLAAEQLRESKLELETAHRQLKDNQAQLLQAEKLASIGQLAAGVAHEINNPIGFILSNLGTLAEYARDLGGLIEIYARLEQLVTPTEAEATKVALGQLAALKAEMDLDYVLADLDTVISESKDGADRVHQIVKDLKEFSHVDREEKMPADLNAGLESTLNIVWNELKYKVDLVKELGDLPEVVCYPMELNQVFMNLLVNAAQAIDTRGTITIRTYVDGDSVCVSIGDTGKGMPPEVKDRIFEPFYTTKDVGQGTGLGLSMAYNIKKKHDGAIEVESEEGAGTSFTVKIPVDARRKEDADAGT